MFAQRLRFILAAVVAAVAAVTTVGVVTPAAATPGTTCTAPQIQGTLTRVLNFSTGKYETKVDVSGFTTATCEYSTTGNREYKYEVDYYRGAWTGNGGAEQTKAGTSTTTSLAPSYGRTGGRIGTSIGLTSQQFAESYFGFTGVFVGIKSYTRLWWQSWSTEPANVDWYRLDSYGSFSTYSMSEDFPDNWHCPTGYSTGKC